MHPGFFYKYGHPNLKDKLVNSELSINFCGQPIKHWEASLSECDIKSNINL